MKKTRREFLVQTGVGLATVSSVTNLWSSESRSTPPVRPLFKPGQYKKINANDRSFHISANCQEILDPSKAEQLFSADVGASTANLSDRDLASIWKNAGVTDVWLNPWGGGGWRYDWKTLDRTIDRIEKLGMTTHFITVPFGHPAQQANADMKKNGWRPALRPTGTVRWGVSCHAPADRACIETVRRIADYYGPCNVFLDDDYRVSDSPYDIGGCICPECKADFQKISGYSDSKWREMLDDLRSNRDVPGVRLWVDWICSRLTKLFKDTESASPEVDLGIMVMGMGSERAGIQLDAYRGKLFRVGEWMFTNEQYNLAKNKTIELFSSLFHRRFVEPGRAFSETTIIQPLSAENYTSKLSISTFSEVRNTMFMCPIPAEYWQLIGPRVKKEAKFHKRLLNQSAQGPFKHYWSKSDRYMAGYKAYSLFLAIGVPFEVCTTEALPKDGWTFLGDASANSLEAGRIISTGTKCIARRQSASGRFTEVPENFDDLFKFRRSLLSGFRQKEIPYIEEETPVVLGWYPGSRSLLLWNIEPKMKTVHLRKGERTAVVELGPLDSAMLEENSDGSFRSV